MSTQSTHSSDMTLEEITESLTGFDEIAIEKHAGEELLSMQNRPTRMVRALVGIDLMRKREISYPEAYKVAMGMPMKEVMEYFAEDEEVMPDEPVTPSGEGDSGRE